MRDLARALIVTGVMFLVAGGLLLLGAQVRWRLPGDIRVERGGFSLYFPLGTCLLVSAVLTVLLNLLLRLRR